MGPGRPPKPIDWDIVEKKMECGSTLVEIAASFFIDETNFSDRFKERYGDIFTVFASRFHGIGKSNLRETQYNKALEGNTSMLTILGQEWLGQGKKTEIEKPPNDEQIDKENAEMSENARLRKRIAELEANGIQNQS